MVFTLDGLDAQLDITQIICISNNLKKLTKLAIVPKRLLVGAYDSSFCVESRTL